MRQKNVDAIVVVVVVVNFILRIDDKLPGLLVGFPKLGNIRVLRYILGILSALKITHSSSSNTTTFSDNIGRSEGAISSSGGSSESYRNNDTWEDDLHGDDDLGCNYW